MPDKHDVEKLKLIDAVQATLNQEDPALAEFSRAFYDRGAAEDLVAYTAEELTGFARDAWQDFQNHELGTHRVSIADPAFKAQGSKVKGVSVIEIVNDNMPFLVDSVMDELQESKIEVHLVLHPIFIVERDDNGTLTTATARKKPPKRTDRQESLIHIHVTRIDSPEARAALKARLDKVLSDVRSVVSDFKPMQERLAEAIDTYKTTQIPGSSDELWEAIHFLEWMENDNFIFLGMREYMFEGGVEEGELSPHEGTGLGLLSDPDVRVLRRGTEFVQITPEIREFLKKPEPLIIAKANVKSTVHRRVHMDYVGAKLYDDEGNMNGELRIVGLFASTAYTEPTSTIPFLRRKVASVLARAGYGSESHSGRALRNVLEAFPRDELFQIERERLFDFSIAILQLDERPRIRVLSRPDKFDRYVSILVFVPRDRYSTEVRLNVGTYLASVYEGRVSAWYVTYPEGPLARVHYIIGRDRGETPTPQQEELEAAVADMVRTWSDSVRDALKDEFAPSQARKLADRYALSFHGGYKEVYNAQSAVFDIVKLETLSDKNDTTITFHRQAGTRDSRLSLKVYHRGSPIPLSARVPLLENMGFRVINERTYRITPADAPMSYLHEMTLESRSGEDIVFSDQLQPRLESMFMAVWTGLAEDDGYNRLVLTAELAWRDVAVIRALSRYLRQAGIRFSEDYMWSTLNNYPKIAAKLVELFHLRFNPDVTEKDRDLGTERLESELTADLEDVASLDDDRILRRFQNTIESILRTNFYQLDKKGQPKPTFAFKINSRQIDDLPQPRPFREIFVYSPRVEGVHLRFGMVARGGLRWSDRPQDFRTEVLGLVKAQQVKNAVIVPVGAKGGFVPKNLPPMSDRDAWFKEGTESYKIFINALLDVTDNLGEDNILPPERVQRYDGDDPYLVVAADKGTATFSDTANGISEGRHFWLGDAFASGGSAGYDHKKMGITARGAWEAVKRHFREMNRDIQTQPFTAAGVGDMSGDVFGNGMLLSKATRLIAAFDHRDIFIDPDPDPAKTWEERKRMFDLGRSSWKDYNTDLISKGGGIFSRQLKSIPLSPEMQSLLNLNKGSATPQEVMTAILKMEVDLLWFGGIGTYIRAKSETDADVGDRANDPIRITASEIGAKVIGEGANLGLTQLARIEFNKKGGRCNSDAIDNSAGVNSSDMEVNIKIALGAAVKSGKLTIEQRNELLAEMTDEVAELVLRNNYLQTLAISMTELRGMEDFGYQVRMMRQLEQAGLLDRVVEQLPDEATLDEMRKAGLLLTRAELGVLLAYAKITLYDALLESSVPDDDYLARELFRYFPDQMADTYKDEISGHRLRREIIATMLANSMINRGGATFITRLRDQTDATATEIAQGFVAVRNSYDLTDLNTEIDQLDTKIDGALQLELYSEIQSLLLERVVWFKRNVSFDKGLFAVVERFRAGIAALRDRLEAVLPEEPAAVLAERTAAFVEQGVPESLARRIAWLPAERAIPDIVIVSEETGADLDTAARAYFEVAHHFQLGAMLELANDLDVRDYYDGLALDRARAMLVSAQRALAIAAVRAGGFTSWLEEHEAEVGRRKRSVSEILDGGLSVSKFSVAASLLAEICGTA
ncbi:NAD-specific glutamate dehydrogenase [Labrenzia sp. THAF191b]|uniref:NAD-glutamate dehydrogenase n=1 Tax=unclassified Labrenzia TaxID=2648686 RepID=UPI001267FB5A|nr:MULTISPECIES: NAD-glutamate dehydrogenase [unclassified Labrenzia]QFS97088.1 NAD-specific glutamate dehydrogenase [Labrenzia sp. THAF191b]QFT03403.1 NAD-specific glutamate dehydrogenase [Labrenzia sp. THAF191a]QFT14945.1 NAD-specific glutamate dehydrogenase [Labrenzia sp. THAF187b]